MKEGRRQTKRQKGKAEKSKESGAKEVKKKRRDGW